MSDDIASEVIAKYAVMGPRVELQRTLPLEPGEILIVGVIAHSTYGDSSVRRGRRGFFGCPRSGCASCDITLYPRSDPRDTAKSDHGR